MFYFIAAFILLQLLADVKEITLQQNYIGVEYANLRLSTGVLLTYLPSYLLKLSQYYDGNVHVKCNLSFAYFHVCCNNPQARARLLQHSFYFVTHKTAARAG